MGRFDDFFDVSLTVERILAEAPSMNLVDPEKQPVNSNLNLTGSAVKVLNAAARLIPILSFFLHRQSEMKDRFQLLDVRKLPRECCWQAELECVIDQQA